jgi:hypothetical protein
MSRPNEMIHCLGVIVWRLHYTVIKLSYLNTSLTGHACTLHIASAMVETDTVPPAPIGHSQPRNTHRFFYLLRQQLSMEHTRGIYATSLQLHKPIHALQSDSLLNKVWSHIQNVLKLQTTRIATSCLLIYAGLQYTVSCRCHLLIGLNELSP